MSRWIDADVLKQNINTAFWSEIGKIIEDAPSIDIVRCAECKHNPWNADADYTCIWDDDFADREQTPDDFCSYGERKESE